MPAARPARFGELRFEGLEGVEEDYLRRLSNWPRGEIFNRSRLDELRRQLSATGLFETVKLREAERIAADGQLPVTAEVKERSHRSIGAGVEYSSSEGAGTRFFWEHRNLFGRAERLRGDLIVAELRQEISGSFIKPNLWQPDQNLRAELAVRAEDSEAFEEQTIFGFIGLERQWRENWTLGAGTSYEYSVIDDQEGEDTFALVGVPLTARYDSSNSLLDPTSGFRITSALTPYVGVLEESTNFLRAEIDASTYYSVLKGDRLVLAVRGKVGSIAGEETDDIPATKRFYGGGGGSVRGYDSEPWARWMTTTTRWVAVRSWKSASKPGSRSPRRSASYPSSRAGMCSTAKSRTSPKRSSGRQASGSAIIPRSVRCGWTSACR